MKTEAVELVLSVKTVQITLGPIHCRGRGAVRRELGEKGAVLRGNMKRSDCARAPQHGTALVGSDFTAPDRRSWLIFAFSSFS